MPDYIEPPIPQEPEDYFALAEDTMQGHAPEWEAADANADVWVLEAGAQMAARVAEVATAVAVGIYLDSGQRLDGLAPIAAVAATGVTTWTAEDNAGYLIPAGSVVGLDIGSDETENFQTIEDYSIPAGSTSLAGVAVTAVEAGTQANGLAAAVAVIRDAPAYIAAVEFTDATGGGEDAETVEAYLARLTAFRRLRAAKPIRAEDYPDFLRESIPGVARATVLDGYHPADVPAEGYVQASYDPDDMTTWRKLTVTVTGVDEDGEPLATEDATAADVLFNGDAAAGVAGIREANWIINVLNAHYTTISVVTTLAVYQGFNPTDVAANAQTALDNFLSPAFWGQPLSGEEIAWANTTILRGSDLYAVLKQVDGVKAVTALTFGISGGAMSTSDLTLPTTATEPIPLTRSGTHTITAA